MPKYLALIIALALAACAAPEIKTAPGYTPGDYRIAQFIVVPAPEVKAGSLNGTPADVARFKELIQPLMLQHMPAYGQKSKDVGMTITVKSIHPTMDSTLEMLLGDGAKVWTQVTLWDMASKQTIGSVTITVTGDTTSGPLSGGADNSTPEKNMEDLAKRYVSKLIQSLYPKP